MNSRLLAVFLSLGAVPFLSVNSRADVMIGGSATSHAQANGQNGFQSDTHTLTLGTGSVSAAAGGGFEQGSGNSMGLFSVATDFSGVVTITGSVTSSASAQDFNEYGPFGSAYASIAANLLLDQPYSYIFTSSGSSGAVASGGVSHSEAAASSVSFNSLGGLDVTGGSFNTSDSGVLAPGLYVLSADASSSASMYDFGDNSNNAHGSASFSLELTPEGSAVPEVGSGVIMGGAMLVLVGLHRFRRQRAHA